ncbi:hypothetical protein JTE90_025794 [Oedothorax gibbosus]|uniref:PiggyBac transposable element-derived protein domain-containing protein n=1 Tax=Oedothorax gibbosus TaxID=931172 RepID=A0AAV6V112_9ARAC|nr:hypothetical protein JTE90_025794 [Oedothorax gibbosus]
MLLRRKLNRKRCQPENHFSTDEEEDLDKSQIQEIEPKKSTKKKKLVKLNDIGSKKPKKLQKNSYAWKKGDKLDPIPSEKAQILEETHPELASKTPYELFRMYFDSDIMNLILEETLRRLYWSNSEDCNLPFIQNAMSRQRFRDIKEFLHLCDNNSIDGSDKLAKKLWILASSQGYPFNIQVYVGKEAAASDKIPLRTRVVLDIIECVENCRRHRLYVDNFFNSLKLLEEMRKKEFRLSGTVRENRLQKCHLQDSTVLAKKETGPSDYIITKDIGVVKWKDNKVVCLASNFECMEPMGQAKRWCPKSKKKIDLPQPGIVGSYNKNMGGVDLLDRFLSSYRPKIKGKKWWWPFFTNTLNMAVVAA